jgi:hypothetical protein
MSVSIKGNFADSLCYGQAVLVMTDDGPGNPARAVVRGLRYEDKWRKTDEGWQIFDRVHTAEWSFETDAMLQPGPAWMSPELS